MKLLTPIKKQYLLKLREYKKLLIAKQKDNEQKTTSK